MCVSFIKNRNILIILIFVIVDILNSFSSFAKPSRPVEYYIYNIHTITLSFVIINFVLKGLTSFTLMYYTWLIKIIKERELKENYLLYDGENSKVMNSVHNTHMSVDLDQSINTSNTKGKRNVFAGDIFEESAKNDNNINNNFNQNNNDNIFRFNNIREEGMLKQNNKYVEGDVIVENCVFTPNKNVRNY